MVEEAFSIRWKFDRATTPWLRRGSYLVFGAFGGLLILGLLSRVRYFQRGLYLEFLVLVAALVVGPALVLGGLLYARRIGEPAADAESEFGWYWVAIAAFGEGVLAWIALSLGGAVGSVAVATLLALAFGGVFALNVVSTEGTLRPDAGTLEVAEPESTIDLGTVQRARTIRIGPVAVVRFVYEPGTYSFADHDTRRLVVTSPRVADELENLLDGTHRE
ncbi:MAG: hypothetical protein QXG03_02070 [Halalkalicoccus sp.]